MKDLNYERRLERMAPLAPEDMLILFRVAHWVECGNRRIVKTIRELAEKEDNYQIIIREIDRVEGGRNRAFTLGAEATLTLLEWLITLQYFEWQCAYCRSSPFQVMSHVISLPTGGTIPENCVPACYGCGRRKKKERTQAQMRVQTCLADRKNWREKIQPH